MERTQCLAAHAVGRVLAGRSLDSELTAVWRQHATLSPQQRGAVQDVAYGALRHLGYIDAVIDRLLSRPLTDLPVRNLLQVTLYQLMHTKAQSYAIVNHAVPAAAKLGFPKAQGLVNAVLRNFLRRRDELDAAIMATDLGRYSYPQWWIDRVAAEYPEAWREILEAGNARPPLTLRVNRRKITRDNYLEILKLQDIAAHAVGRQGIIIEKPRPVSMLPGFAEGQVSVQDAGAQLAAELLDDIDLTAADIDAQRLQRVTENLTRLSLNAKLLQADAGNPAAWRNAGLFDRILADVPCTASGVVRRHPDIKWLRKPADIAAMGQRQAQILDTLWQLLGRGGKLLYATCSVFSEENGRQVEQFTARHPDARQIAFAFPAEGLRQSHGQLFPDAAHDGFFYALLEKV
jgi:16S rRNA (cytosine967-C5)-methyltransferase